MKTVRLIWTLALMVVFASGFMAAEDGMEIFRKSDNAFFPSQAKFSFRVEEYENDQYRRYYLSEGYLKGDDRYLLAGLEPAVFKGVVQLRVADTIFTYLKKVDKTSQVSAKVAFYDTDLSQEDVMSTKLSNFYNLEGFSKETAEGRNLWVLRLTAKTKEVAYYKIVSYINAENYLPLKREYFSFSGQKVKEMIYEEVQISGGKLVSLKFTMFNLLRKGFYSKVVLDQFVHDKPIPDIYFTKTYMKAIAR